MNSTIVITGMGLVSPLGCGVNKVWQRLCSGESGIASISHFDSTDFPVQIAGMVPGIHDDPSAGLDEENLLHPKDRKKLDRFSVFAIAAAKEALQQAQWSPSTDSEQNNTATIIGSGIGGFSTITKAHETLLKRGYKRISPFTVPAFLANLAAGNVSIRFGLKGPLGCPVTACAAGLQAIGDGVRLIRNGEAKVALVGGTEACVSPLSLASFHAMKALSTINEHPQKASRPYDRDRDGFVMAEGAGLLVIEALEHALDRGAQPLAVISGYGTSADAYHISAGPENGSGAAAAINRALMMAGLAPSDIDHVNAHATSTPVGDQSEIAALRAVFKEGLKNIPISATKSATGHTLGAAGGIESIFTTMALQEGTLPPTLNLEQVDDGFEDLDFVHNKSRRTNISHALCNGFGFGGVNASLIISKY